jgi:anti-sigma factor RsiW
MTSDNRQDEEQKEDGIDAAEEERMIRIMQYCDGVLPAREAALVAEEIARDPEAARLAAEMSAGANAARNAWSKFASGPVPLELARRVAQSAREPVPHRAAAAPVVDWRIAASLVVGIALGMLGLMLTQHNGDQGLRLAGSDRIPDSAVVGADPSWQPALMTALAKDPETTSVSFGASGTENTVRVARWFDTTTGLRCAEFAKSTGGAVNAGGIACKKPDGGWDVIEQAK